MFAAGCGSGSVGYSEGKGDRANGKELFIQKCGSCHTLADAGTSGKISPNLDYAFFASRRDGLGESTFVQVVRGQIAYPVVKPSTGAPGMPANILEGQEADDVASYVGQRRGRRRSEPDDHAACDDDSRARRAVAGGAGNVAAGKSVFDRPAAPAAHTLADAGATGAVGPNLDDAKPDAALVKERVTNGKAVMPSFKGQLSAPRSRTSRPTSRASPASSRARLRGGPRCCVAVEGYGVAHQRCRNGRRSLREARVRRALRLSAGDSSTIAVRGPSKSDRAASAKVLRRTGRTAATAWSRPWDEPAAVVIESAASFASKPRSASSRRPGDCRRRRGRRGR